MDKLSCAVFSLLIGFLISIVVAIIILPILRKKHCEQFLSEYLEDRHKTKKRIFPMTPIHHTFELKGWNERDIVKLFWVIGLLASLVSLIYGIWL